MIQIKDTIKDNAAVETLNVTVRDVTGTHTAQIDDLDRNMPVGEVAQAVASRMSLATDTTPWALRSEHTAEYLNDGASIGEALEGTTEVSLVLTPKAHLG